MLRLNSEPKRVDVFFILGLFALFALTTFVVIIIGAGQYKKTADSMDQNYESRTVTSYLEEQIHQHDSGDGISIVDFEGSKAIAMKSVENGENYTTFIYYYDGYIRELYVGDDALYVASSGQKIIEVNSFEPSIMKDGLIQVIFTDTNDLEYSVYLNTIVK